MGPLVFVIGFAPSSGRVEGFFVFFRDPMLIEIVDRIGLVILNTLEQAGDFAVISGRAFASIFRRPFDGANLMYQFMAVGVNSIPVILLTSLAVSASYV